MANNCDFALSSCAFAKSAKRAKAVADQLNAGMSSVNDLEVLHVGMWHMWHMWDDGICIDWLRVCVRMIGWVVVVVKQGVVSSCFSTPFPFFQLQLLPFDALSLSVPPREMSRTSLPSINCRHQYSYLSSVYATIHSGLHLHVAVPPFRGRQKERVRPFCGARGPPGPHHDPQVTKAYIY